METGCRISSTAGAPGSSGTGASMSLTTDSVHAAPFTLTLVGAKSCAVIKDMSLPFVSDLVRALPSCSWSAHATNHDRVGHVRGLHSCQACKGSTHLCSMSAAA